MWRFGRYSERGKRKSPFSTTPLSFDATVQRTPAIIHKILNLLETGILALHFCRSRSLGSQTAGEIVMNLYESVNSQHKNDLVPCRWTHRRRRRGQGGHEPPKIRENIFSGNYYVKFGHFLGKNHVKFGNFVNFSGKYNKNSGILIIFRARIM